MDHLGGERARIQTCVPGAESTEKDVVSDNFSRKKNREDTIIVYPRKATRGNGGKKGTEPVAHPKAFDL